jgi:hypothetical protein
MLFEVIDEDVRVRLAQSMAVVDRHRAEIIRKIDGRLVAEETGEAPLGQAEVVATMLVTLLIDCVGDLAAFGGLRHLGVVAKEHRRLRIDGRHYSRFGMALAPALRELLGPRVSPQIISAWCDAYWFVIRTMKPDESLSIVRA